MFISSLSAKYWWTRGSSSGSTPLNERSFGSNAMAAQSRTQGTIVPTTNRFGFRTIARPRRSSSVVEGSLRAVVASGQSSPAVRTIRRWALRRRELIRMKPWESAWSNPPATSMLDSSSLYSELGE